MSALFFGGASSKVDQIHIERVRLDDRSLVDLISRPSDFVSVTEVDMYRTHHGLQCMFTYPTNLTKYVNNIGFQSCCVCQSKVEKEDNFDT